MIFHRLFHCIADGLHVISLLLKGFFGDDRYPNGDRALAEAEAAAAEAAEAEAAEAEANPAEAVNTEAAALETTEPTAEKPFIIPDEEVTGNKE